jgi:plastocyanin
MLPNVLSRWVFVLAAVAAPLAHAQYAEIAATVTDARGKPLADAVVVVVPADGNIRLPSRAPQDVVDQVDKEFVPKVQAILVGTAVTFPNRDTVRHQVYSFSPAKRFELPLYTGVSQAVTFDKPGVVVLGCNIHDWMVGYIYVSESPYFAKTDATGRAVLLDLPPRTYVVRVWHPQLIGVEEDTRKNVDASRAGRSEVAWTLTLKAEVRIRHAPMSGSHGAY